MKHPRQERAFQDREIVYFLRAGAHRSACIRHRSAVKAPQYLNIARRSTVSDPRRRTSYGRR